MGESDTKLMLVEIFKVGFPSMISIFLVILVEFINLIFIGTLNDPAMMVGVGLGNMFVNITTVSIILGLNSALATFVSQCYG
jgi:Na+-driven multidrug efflux pump